MSIKSDGFVVIGGDAIWGVGSCEGEAWADFLQNMQSAGISVVARRAVDDNGGFSPEETLESDYQVVEATKALIAAVNERGGNIAWSQIGVVCCTNDEFAAQGEG